MYKAPDRISFILAFLLVFLRDLLPPKDKAPVKVSTVTGTSCGDGFGELHVVLVNDDYLRADHSSGLFHYPSQEGFQPAIEALT